MNNKKDKIDIASVTPVTIIPDAETMVYLLYYDHLMYRANADKVKTMVAGITATLDRYERNSRSNNWLKMHGYPMRRKCGKG